MMSCVMRFGLKIYYVKEGMWMPVWRRSLDRSYSTVKKTSKKKTKEDSSKNSVSVKKVKGEDVPEKMCHIANAGNESIRDTNVRVEKETQTSEETAGKRSYPKISDFLIKNIMSFPIHGPPDDSKENYQPDDSKMNSFPSVSTILNETMSPQSRTFLEKWKRNMIAQVGAEKFSEMQKDPVKKLKLKKCSKRSKKILTATLCRGSRLHHAIQRYLLGEDVSDIIGNDNEIVEGCWKSVMTALPHVSNVKLVESWVYHPHLHYKGIVDCVACFKNVPHVIEWKQSEKPKKNIHDTFDAPIQLCAYMGTMPWCKTEYFTEPITHGLVVIAYVDGSPADIFPLNSESCQGYWEQWLRRLQKFWLTHSPELKDSLC